MRTPKWTTSRWRIPGRLRIDRFAQLLARKDLNEVLGSDFAQQIEKRRDLLESRQLKLLGIQAPLFLFLAFSLLNLDINISVFGLSTATSKSLREILLMLSTSIGVASSSVNYEIRFVKEMLRAHVKHVSKSNKDLSEFLQIRFGLSSVVSPINSFDEDLQPSIWQYAISILWILVFIIMIGFILAIALSVQFLVLVEVYRHPNYSPEISIVVISFVLLGDFLSILALLWQIWLKAACEQHLTVRAS